MQCMARSKVIFAKIVDTLLHWLRVDTHGNILLYPNVEKFALEPTATASKFLDLSVPKMAVDLF